jgi:ABC-type multidrug transport system ATPase subunit
LISIQINSVGKKFGPEWVFRNLFFDIEAGDKVVILGGNGSGKSTLLQVISGFAGYYEGSIEYTYNGKQVEEDELKSLISFASPYLQLIEDFTLTEMVEHSAMFKPFKSKLSSKEVIEIIQLGHAKNKFIKQFSSGMKQRLKLGLAILADTPMLLLDEPVSNLDKEAITWYKDLLTKNSEDRTVIVCSNKIDDEYFLCTKQLDVTNFKPQKSTV